MGNDEVPQAPEIMKIVDHMLIFDVDGVISDLKEKKANPEVLLHIARDLTNGIPIALNTGRSIDWVVTRAGKTLIENPELRPFLKNLIIIGEKGAAWMTFDDEGNPEEHVDKTISVPLDLREDIRSLIENKYSGSMFYDAPKKTAASVEMNDGYDMGKYAKDQQNLIPEVNFLIKKYLLQDTLRLESNQIAIDVEDKRVGKHLGVSRLLQWLKDKKIQVNNFTTVGDNEPDIKMAEELHKNNFPVTHVHVGVKEIKSDQPFKVIITKKHYTEGTEEFLKSL